MIPQQIAYSKAQYEYDNQVPDNSYEPGLEDETAEQIFDRLPEQSKDIFLGKLANRVNYGRAFRVLTEELSDQTSISQAEGQLQEIKAEMIEELEYPQSKIDNLVAYMKLRRLLITAYYSYKVWLKSYLKHKNSNNPLTEWTEGQMMAYRYMTHKIIQQMKRIKRG